MITHDLFQEQLLTAVPSDGNYFSNRSREAFVANMKGHGMNDDDILELVNRKSAEWLEHKGQRLVYALVKSDGILEVCRFWEEDLLSINNEYLLASPPSTESNVPILIKKRC